MSLEQDASRKDAALRDVLQSRISGWASYPWPFEGSPLAVLAEFAADPGIQGFEPARRAVVESIASPAYQASVRAARSRFTR